MKLLLDIEVFSMAFLREIGRNGVLYSGIWPRHKLSNQMESNLYIRKSIAFIQIEKRMDINDIPINNWALGACYGISNRIEKYIN